MVPTSHDPLLKRTEDHSNHRISRTEDHSSKSNLLLELLLELLLLELLLLELLLELLALVVRARWTVFAEGAEVLRFAATAFRRDGILAFFLSLIWELSSLR
jgi:hypothetical protein